MCFLLSAPQVDSDGHAMANGGIRHLYTVFQKIKQWGLFNFAFQ
jgi:hypothetical protein